ncbi:MAG: FAD:protein FMN transferase [Bacteroidales bacterium]|nr:FAD:protein FMN transferase [Bacteroidales bacterium]MCF8404072.1 FAD:protein FMN transferase [Bacteroidales bacterium]
MKKIPYFIVFLSIVFCSCNKMLDQEPVKFNGETQGTYYQVTYFDNDNRNFQKEIDQALADFDMVASMWVDNSIISLINRNATDVKPDPVFQALFSMSKSIYEKSGGAFDPTIGPLVNAWGFGFTDRMKVDQHIVDSILEFVGFDKVTIEADKITKKDPRVQFDFNAIAQGYSVDLIGQLLEKNGIKNYLIDIGGEVMAKGMKPDKSIWKVGIEKPKDNAQYGEGLKAIVELKNKAMATSGNYRKFYEVEGVRYSHTIDPKTGYPVQHSILSVSVIADSCGMADGWATAFMVMGFEKSIEILAKDKSLDAYFIYSGNEGNIETHATTGMKKYLLEEMD